MRKALAAILFTASLLGSFAVLAAERVSQVRVLKEERLMELRDGDKIVRRYSIALGGDPVGHKRQEGDRRTPEGRYVLDWRNASSGYYRSIHISYPDAADKAAAAEAGVSPGGMVMIHGQPNGFGWMAWALQMFDWTNGCIAVDNAAMAEIWKMVPNGTPIEILP